MCGESRLCPLRNARLFFSVQFAPSAVLLSSSSKGTSRGAIHHAQVTRVLFVFPTNVPHCHTCLAQCADFKHFLCCCTVLQHFAKQRDTKSCTKTTPAPHTHEPQIHHQANTHTRQSWREQQSCPRTCWASSSCSEQRLQGEKQRRCLPLKLRLLLLQPRPHRHRQQLRQRHSLLVQEYASFPASTPLMTMLIWVTCPLETLTKTFR